MTGTAPTPRDNYSHCLIGDRWLVHGGNDVFRELKNDTYMFDFHTAEWSVVRTYMRMDLVVSDTVTGCGSKPFKWLLGGGVLTGECKVGQPSGAGRAV
jgi:hypothetical protein